MNNEYDFLKNISAQPKKSIHTETSKNSKIDNQQYAPNLMQKGLSDFIIKQTINKFPPLHIRTHSTNCYNCHGMTFASRRTGIFESSEVEKILKEDDYAEVGLSEVIPGDIIIYTDSRGDREHSGIVLSINGLGDTKIPMILSKWGMAQEVVHSAYSSPYDEHTLRYYRCKL
jgi:hypothetical protein